MTQKVHNHGPEEGPGAACPEHLIGECITSWWAEMIALPTKIAALSHDNGEYDVYVGYFDNRERLEAAVAKLKAERLDMNADEPPDCEVRPERIHRVPAEIDDVFLDLLAGMLDDAGADVERADQRAERLREEAIERGEPLPFVPSPGQTDLDSQIEWIQHPGGRP